MKIGIIIQARLGSTRLPNKMILPFYNEMGILELILLRLAKLTSIPIIVATTTSKRDDEIEKIALKHNMNCFRGNENNVLDRFIQAATKFELDKVIRICADNPFLDLPALKSLINHYSNKQVDYCAFYTRDGKPTIQTHFGFWAEGVSVKALKQIEKNTKDPLYLEHVTNYIYSNSDDFSIHKELIPKTVDSTDYLRLTLDTEEDFNLLKEIYAYFLQNDLELKSEMITSKVLQNDKWLTVMKTEILNNKK